MKRILSIFVAVFVLAAFSANAKVVKMNLNAIYGATSIHTMGAKKFAELTKRYSKGSVLITVYPGGSLGFKGPELLRVVKDGQVPLSDILMGVVAGSEHVFGISSLPRLVTSFKEARSLYEECKPLYEKAALKWNQKFLYAAPWPPSGLVTKKAIKSTKDLKGLKIRTYDKNGANFLRTLGANAVSMPWGDVYSALRTNMIQGVLTSAESAKNGKFWEVLKYFTDIHYAYPLNMVTINLDYWKALSKEQQAAVLKAAKETEDAQWRYSEEITKANKGILISHKMTFEEPSKALSKDMNKAAKQIIDEFLSKSSKQEKAVIEKYLNK